jgi:hypothetical protein
MCHSEVAPAVLCCAVQEERDTLREQLCAVPAEADPTGIAINVAKVGLLVALELVLPLSLPTQPDFA